MKIIAHRGDSANFPENTPEGWEAAYRDGAFAIEADIRLSSDGACICAHDPDLRRLFDRSERVEELPLDTLLALRNEEGGRIARLADVLTHAQGGRAVLLDLKDETPAALDAIWSVIAETVPAAQRHLVIAGCHSLEAVRFFAGKGETGILGFIPEERQAEAFFDTGAVLIRLWDKDVSPERVAQLHGTGAEVWVTTGGRGMDLPPGDLDPDRLAVLVAAGVRGVLINDVATVRAELEAMR